MSKTGVIVGCDRTLEPLLPWWWKHYSAHNDTPVAFADFGMSASALRWCQERGICLAIPQTTILDQSQIPEEQQRLWETLYGAGLWHARAAWFLKPLALLKSPFSIGLWIDLDCQVLCPLDSLFHTLNLGADIALVREPHEVEEGLKILNILYPQETYYNSGVILFRKDAEILHRWLKESMEHNAAHTGDQGALCRAIYQTRPALIELPATYNWLNRLGPNPDAQIVHFSGNEKFKILTEIVQWERA
jgi:hypothetical protein